jgi:pyridoxamine 5'-phosphate oxidase
MSGVKKTFWTETLPEPLPGNPMSVLSRWLSQARDNAQQPNPNAMVLATVDAEQRPSARVVLCKDIQVDAGFIVFYSNYLSRKGAELQSNPRAAAVFHWDHVHRQARIEGTVQRLSAADSDAYFASRPWQSRLGAWASRQSEPVSSRGALAEAVAREAQRFGIPYAGPGSAEPEGEHRVPRPPHWGGYKLIAEAVELWVEGEFRIHDRARYTRQGLGAAWSATRLQP